MTDDQPSAHELDRRIAGVFGRKVDPESTLVGLFEDAGLCTESANTAARGLEEGRYFSFEDAALAQTVFDQSSRNYRATPTLIAEVAKRREAGSPVSEDSSKVTAAKTDYDRLVERSDRLRDLEGSVGIKITEAGS